jgi:Asp-tRNA(Asn)/Glu-tRNA(Gln) amidotransferase A subunit family amidase
VIPRDLDACLARIRERDASVHAWVHVDPQPATGEGPLSGVPFGAKDIIETRGLPTEFGSPIYRGRIGTHDAWIITELRRHGAILVGKTHTTAFAHRDPAPTRNPHHLDHTPGGSSSGSAAAVADGMVPLALGTQTQGSVLRPASFCGIVGFKATYGLLSMEGILPFAPSLDTLGFFTRSIDDAADVFKSLVSEPYVRTRHSVSVDIGVPDPLPLVDLPMTAAFHAALDRLRAAGMTIRAIDLGDMLDRLNHASRVVMCYEAARVHEARYREHGDALGQLVAIIQEGLATSDASYAEARRYIDASRERVRQIYETTPAILVPAAVGPAPSGLASTGDPRMNAPWTALGTPAISIPMGAHEGLPLGLQITADCGEDSFLLDVAKSVERALSDGPHVGRTLSGSP